MEPVETIWECPNGIICYNLNEAARTAGVMRRYRCGRCARTWPTWNDAKFCCYKINGTTGMYRQMKEGEG